MFTMNDRTNLQIPISVELKKEVEKIALSMGFSSLQEYLRVLMTGVARGEIQFPMEWVLSDEKIQQYEKDLDELKKDIQKGKAKSYTMQEFFKHLDNL